MNNLKSWVDAGRGRGSGLARHLGVPPSFVSKMANGEKPIPIEHGAAIERFTAGQVTRRELFPDSWHRIWPELADVVAPPAAPAAQGAEQGGAAQDVSGGHGKNFCPTEPLNTTQQSCGGL